MQISTSKKLPENDNVRCWNGICGRDRDEVARTVSRSYYDSTEKQLLSRSENHTVASEPIYPGIVVYNRVPKCASSTVRFLITKLQKIHRFLYKVHNWPSVKQSLTPSEENDLVQEVASLRPPAFFLRHLHFVDFSKYNVTKPAYINVIRDPVDRFVSHYYFSRYGFDGWSEKKVKKWLWPMPEERRNMSLNECVEQGAEKCVRDNKENMLDFFCGQDKRCKKHDDWSLERAKGNIANNYVFIGILERLEDSLKVAEVLLPRYFGGAINIYRNSPDGSKHTKTARKKEPSEEARRALKKALRREMDLYDFVKKRFEIQFEALKSSGYIT